MGNTDKNHGTAGRAAQVETGVSALHLFPDFCLILCMQAPILHPEWRRMCGSEWGAFSAEFGRSDSDILSIGTREAEWYQYECKE
jgi:hypothetical protein